MYEHAKVGVFEQIQTRILRLEDGSLLPRAQVLSTNDQGLLTSILHAARGQAGLADNRSYGRLIGFGVLLVVDARNGQARFGAGRVEWGFPLQRDGL